MRSRLGCAAHLQGFHGPHSQTSTCSAKMRLPISSLLLALCGSVLASTSAALAQDGTPPIPADTEIQTTASGLKYSVLSAGDLEAKPPGPFDTVKVHYTGWLLDGSMFDSSRQRGTPAEFPLDGVIAGWTEGLQLMKPGARVKFTIPYDLAYGENGRPPTIPAKATLIFDVELLEVTNRKPEPPPFVALDPEQTTTKESGLKVQVISEGEGTVGADTPLGMHYDIWNMQGELLQSTQMQDAALYDAFSNMARAFRFLGEVHEDVKIGGTYLFEVPATIGLGAHKHPKVGEGEPTIWRIRVTGAFSPPEFRMPAEEELTTTASGLKYKILREGDGETPALTNQATCHYTGWLTDGTEFDSSFARKRPSTFALRGVIKGWTEGLQLMKEGDRAVFVIPGKLGYGARGSAPHIGPDATLVFVIDLINIP